MWTPLDSPPSSFSLPPINPRNFDVPLPPSNLDRMVPNENSDWSRISNTGNAAPSSPSVLLPAFVQQTPPFICHTNSSRTLPLPHIDSSPLNNNNAHFQTCSHPNLYHSRNYVTTSPPVRRERESTSQPDLNDQSRKRRRCCVVTTTTTTTNVHRSASGAHSTTTVSTYTSTQNLPSSYAVHSSSSPSSTTTTSTSALPTIHNNFSQRVIRNPSTPSSAAPTYGADPLSQYINAVAEGNWHTLSDAFSLVSPSFSFTGLPSPFIDPINTGFPFVGIHQHHNNGATPSSRWQHQHRHYHHHQPPLHPNLDPTEEEEDEWEDFDDDEEDENTTGAGVQPVSLAALQLSEFAFSSKEASIKEKLCVICQDDFQDGDQLVSLHCEHSFHSGCISRWLSCKLACPLCNKSAIGV